ncbi:MAG: 3-hydroxyacyl-CoA dehydrogenase/enoyl-CoA hydratase family protein [Bacteroidetes bacterium]|jgi:3-hydroxyacyl-CoA dehydrogenase|nr:3-hydroxyacyl-CoA dehydrogenase/enoyl-CoA hydratase family protein [Bacteroidota bacterium]
MKRTIQSVAVLGSGIMGSRIACHFANAGFKVMLLDIAPKELNDDEKKAGLTLDDFKVRNRIVNSSLQATLKSNPSPIYHKSFVSRINTGNFTDNLKDINQCDWVIEVIIENLEIKKSLFAQLDQLRKPGTLITSNTSGIPIHLMTEGRSDDFKKHFCGTHFFNPPRYLPLLEIIPGPDTDADVLDFLQHFGDRYLGKTTVLCKDTPAFIANRIGVFGIMSLFHAMKQTGLTISEIDKLTGTVIGRPKSATFRTSDVVGLDTLVHVANDAWKNLPNDEQRDKFKLPEFIEKMVDNKWLGDKTKQGFYKKVKNKDGKSEILELDLDTLEYKTSAKSKFQTLEAAKPIDDLNARLPILIQGKDKAGDFYRLMYFSLFSYVSFRIPEITDDLYKIDEAMCAGFGWEQGPFETWDCLGVKNVSDIMQKNGFKLASWVDEMLNSGVSSFYKTEKGVKSYYSTTDKKYKPVPGNENFIILKNSDASKIVWKNSGCAIHDIGDGVLNLEFKTKMNTIGSEVLQGMNTAVELAEKNYRGLVIGNEGANFSAGANLALIFMLAVEQEYDELDYAIRAFQNTNMRLRYSSVPVVVAPHGLTLGGGCEMSLHADKVCAAAETYIGLVEFGVGLIPGGGGTKELTVRFADSLKEGDIETNAFRDYFLTIGQAKVSTSAYEAFDLHILRKGHDEITLNKKRLIADAKRAVLEMAEAGYVKPIMRNDIRVLGREGMGIVQVGANAMQCANYISEYDAHISLKLGYIMCGGNLSAPTKVSEQYLLNLEREAFLSLLGEKKTLERIQSILTTGKPLRN